MNLSLNKEQIKCKQLFFSANCYLQGITALAFFVMPFAKNDTWFFTLTGLIEGLFIAWILMTLAKSYPFKTLFAINDIVLVQKAGKATSVFLLLLFLSLLLLNIRKIGDFIFCFSIALLLKQSLYVFCSPYACIDAY